MKRKFELVDFVGKLALYAFLIASTIIFIFPLYFAIASSFKTDTAIFSEPFRLPGSLNFSSYAKAWKIADIWTCLKNSFALSGANVVITLLVGSMAAYILAKFIFRLRSAVYIYFICGLMIPIQSVVIPLSIMINKLHLNNNFMVVILLFTAFNLPFAVFVLTAFIRQLPSELEEAAIIDGAGTFRIFTSIILPLIVPALATVSIFIFMFTWKDLLIPLLFLQKAAYKTLSLGLLTFKGMYLSSYALIMATVVIMVLPLIAIYIVAQEKVIKGMTAGAVKG